MTSIVAQTFGVFEVIVADHSSPDDTWDKGGGLAGGCAAGSHGGHEHLW